MNESFRLGTVEGGRKELGRQLIRAMVEGRSNDVRAIADRIAHRGSLQPVVASDADSPPRTEEIDAQPPR